MNFKFFDLPGIKELFNLLGTACDSDVFSSCDLPRLLQCALHPVIDKMECSTALSLPSGFAGLAFNPAMNPSNDIPVLKNTLLIVAVSI